MEAAARRPRHGMQENAGKRQTAGCNAGTAKAYRRAWWKLPRGSRTILGVLSFKGFKGFKGLKAGNGAF